MYWNNDAQLSVCICVYLTAFANICTHAHIHRPTISRIYQCQLQKLLLVNCRLLYRRSMMVSIRCIQLLCITASMFNVSMYLSSAYVAFLQLVATPHGHLLLRWHMVLQVYRTTHNLRCIYNVMYYTCSCH